MTILIVGAGLSGISLARFLQKDFLLVEKESDFGGLTRSVSTSGFTFDYAGHFLHWRSPLIFSLAQKILRDDFQVVLRHSAIYEFDRYIPFPFQANLEFLPPDIHRICQAGLPSKQPARSTARSFSEWAKRNFGPGIFRYFLRPYNEKLWKINLDKLSAEWCPRFIPALRGKNKEGYNPQFIYPQRGGIFSLTKNLAKKIKIHTSCAVDKINWQKKYALLSSGQKIYYHYLVNTSPLPDFLNRFIDLPQAVRQAGQKLKANVVYCLNLGTEKVPFDWHWLYFPEKKYPFYRLGVYSNIAPAMAPAGQSSIYIEWSRRPEEKFDYRQQETIVGKILKQKKIIGPVLVRQWLKINPGYVIYDFYRRPALKIIEKFLTENRIFSLGRYGKWQYSFMEEDILGAKKLAELLNHARD